MVKQRSLSRTLGALVGVAVMFVGAPWALIAVSRARFQARSPLDGVHAPWRWTGADVQSWWHRLTGGLTTTDQLVEIFVRVALCVMWVCVAVLAWTIVSETVYQLRHGVARTHRRSLIGFGRLSRMIATGLVGLLPMTLTATPAFATAPLRPAPAIITTHPGVAPHTAARTALGEVKVRDTPPHSTVEAAGWSTYTVQRNDSILGIAGRIADGRDVNQVAQQILDANLGTTMPDGHRFVTAALIEPGWQLSIPTPTIPTPTVTLPPVTTAPVTNTVVGAAPAATTGSTTLAPTSAQSDPTTVTGDTGIADSAAPTGVVEYVAQDGDSYWKITAAHLPPEVAADPAMVAAHTRTMIEINAPRLGYHDPKMIHPGDILDISTLVAATTPNVDNPAAPPVAVPEPTPAAPTDTTPPVPPVVVAAVPAPASTQSGTPTVTTVPIAPAAPAVAADTPAGDVLPVPTTAPAPPPAPSRSPAVVSGGAVVDPVAVGELVPVRDTRPIWLAGVSGSLVLASALYARYRQLRRRSGLRGARRFRPGLIGGTNLATARALRTNTDMVLLAWANTMLGELTAHVAGRPATLLAVELSPDSGLTVCWLTPPAGDPPAQWSADGARWSRAFDPDDTFDDTQHTAVLPGLVTIGAIEDRTILVDVEAFGSLAVCGDPTRSEDLVRAMVLELGAGGPLSNSTVHVVGLDVDAAEQLGKIHSRTEADAFEQLDTVARTNQTILDAGKRTSMFDLRVHDGAHGRNTTVVAARASALADPDRFVAAARPGIGAVVVLAGDSHGCSATIRVDPGGEATLEPFGITVNAAGLPRRTAAAVSILLAAAGHTLRADTDDTYEPDHTLLPTNDHDQGDNPVVLVRVLGRPSIDGHPTATRRDVQLIAYVASHGGTATDDAVIDAVWAGRCTRDRLWAHLTVLNGRLPGLVTTRAEGSNHVRLAPGVITDVDLIRRRVTDARRTADQTEALDMLQQAMRLATGEPFDSVGYDWADDDDTLATAWETIEACCVELAQRAATAGNIELARTTITRGLELFGVNEVLTQTLLRIEHTAGNPGDPAPLLAAYHDLQVGLLDVTDHINHDLDPSPSTIKLLARLSPGSAPTKLTSTMVEHAAVVGSDIPLELDWDADLDEEPAPSTRRPRVLLRVFGTPAVDGAVLSQAVAAPFLVAAARRPMTGTEISELTGYSTKTMSTVFTTSHLVLTRDDGELTLADGVVTEHDWIADNARHAQHLAARGDVPGALDALRTVFAAANRVDGRPYEHPTGRSSYWHWVDEYPTDIPARNQAEQTLIEAVLTSINVWTTMPGRDTIGADHVVDVSCRLAELLPHTPISNEASTNRWHSSAEALLVAARNAAGTQTVLAKRVVSLAMRLVADGTLTESVQLADDLCL